MEDQRYIWNKYFIQRWLPTESQVAALDYTNGRKQLLIREISRKFHEYQEAHCCEFHFVLPSHENVTSYLLEYLTLR